MTTIPMIEQALSNLSLGLIRTRKQMYVMQAAAKLDEIDRQPALPIDFKSQFGEDVYLWDLFEGKTDGFFIEVGAFDGVSNSVSYAFEAVGWKGLLVEAIPAQFEKCRANRPNSTVIHAALGSGSEKQTQFIVTTDHFGGMLSYVDKDSDHRDIMRRQGTHCEKIMVPSMTMNDALSACGKIPSIDVAVIDVEGSELDLLGGFDLDRWKPKVLMIEDNSVGQDERLTKFFDGKPYMHVGWVQMNRVYVRVDEPRLIERAHAIGNF